MSTGIQKDIDMIWGSVGIVYCLFGIIGNGFLAFVFLRLRRKQSVTDIIFLQLAVLDCLSGFAGLFGSIFLVNGRRWFEKDDPAADAICYPAGMMWNMASLTTPLLLSCASVGRFLAVYAPFAYERCYNLAAVKCMIIYCWAHGLLGASISFAGPNKEVKAYQMFVEWGYCDQAIFDAYKNNETARKLIYIMLFTIPVIVACLSIIVCNLMVALKILIMKHQYRHKKRVMSMALCSVGASEDNQSAQMSTLSNNPYLATNQYAGPSLSTNQKAAPFLSVKQNAAPSRCLSTKQKTGPFLSANQKAAPFLSANQNAAPNVHVTRQNSYSTATSTITYVTSTASATPSSNTMASKISSTLTSINNTLKRWYDPEIRGDTINKDIGTENINNFNNISGNNNTISDNSIRAPVIALDDRKPSTLSCRDRTVGTMPNDRKCSTLSTPYRRTKRKNKQRRRRENQAILMTILLSINYLVCYIEIIHYYVVVSIGGNWEQSYTVVFSNVTYVYLWYYFSLFCAAGNNCLLHFCFNPNVKKNLRMIVMGNMLGPPAESMNSA